MLYGLVFGVGFACGMAYAAWRMRRFFEETLAELDEHVGGLRDHANHRRARESR